MQKILVIEDEIKTQCFIQRGLLESGHSVECASDGHSGLQLAIVGRFDLIIMDVMLPKMDGWEILKSLRSRSIKTPVIFLTAKDSVEDKVKGLDLGANDYLVKPFAFSELLARIRVHLRQEKDTGKILKISDLEIDLINLKATRGTQTLDLTAKEFKILTLLAQKKGEIISKKMIAEIVWNIKFDTGTNIVEVHMRRLRAKMDETFTPKLIHTIRGLGYTLKEE